MVKQHVDLVCLQMPILTSIRKNTYIKHYIKLNISARLITIHDNIYVTIVVWWVWSKGIRRMEELLIKIN